MKKFFYYILLSTHFLLSMEPVGSQVNMEPDVSSAKHLAILAKQQEKFEKEQEKARDRFIEKETKKDAKVRKRKEKKERKNKVKEQRATLKKETIQFLKIQKLINVLLGGKEKEIKKILKDQKNPLNVINKEGQSPVNCVLNNNKADVLRLLASMQIIDLAFAGKDGCTPLHTLFKKEDWQIIPEWQTMYAILIEYFNGKGIEEKNPFEAINEEEAERRINIINTQDKKGWTPLHWAVRHNNVEAVRVLCANGANVDSNLFDPDSRSDTPLETAYSEEMEKVLERLSATKRKKIMSMLETRKPKKINPVKKSEKSIYPICLLQAKKKEQPKEQETRERPVSNLEQKRTAGTGTMHRNWNARLKIQDQSEQSLPGAPVCSSGQLTTFPQPNYKEVTRRLNRSSSVAVVSPSLSLTERVLQKQRKIRQQHVIENVQSQSCPVLPLAAISPRKKLGRTRRAKSAIEKLGSKIQKKEVKDKKEEIVQLPPPILDIQPKSSEIIIGIVNGQEELELPPRPSTPKRPPIPNYETKPKTPQTSQSFSYLPQLAGNSQQLQEG